jgi:hypothetical protein
MVTLRKFVRAAKRKLFWQQGGSRRSRLFRLRPEGKVRGRMLLSLATRVYERTLRGEPLDANHIAPWQNVNIARTFLDLGFIVDVMNWNDHEVQPDGAYDVLIDVTANIERLAGLVGDNCTKILHPMFAHCVVHNANIYTRYAGLLRRRGVVLPPLRLLPTTASAEIADHIILRGGPFVSKTYSHVPAQIHYIPQMHPFGIDEFLNRDMEACRRRFVWLGGRGCIHKGLDLTLEAFRDLPDCELYVCGQISNEPEFESLYRSELYDLPNIHTIGWIDTMSPRWKEIISRCAAIILPSTSELSCGSVICCMISGLIPVASDETDIDLSDIGIRIRDASVEGVKEAICALRDRQPSELTSLSRAAYDAAHDRFGRKRFLDAYRSTVSQILGIEPCKPWTPWNAKPSLPDIERIEMPSA